MKDNQVQTHTDGGTVQPAPSYESILSQEGIRVTAVRLLVLKAVYALRGAFTLQDVVDKLGTADPSSVFRTLTLFADKGLLHLIDDGSGAQKYCVCHCEDHHHHHGHIHFTCTVCHKTFCLTEVPIPPVPVPQGFHVEESEYVIKGVCPNCHK
jgi:Fur family ferric uptake transcriptional regulator